MAIGSWRYRGQNQSAESAKMLRWSQLTSFSCVPHDSSGDAGLDGKSSGRGLDWFDLFWMATG